MTPSQQIHFVPKLEDLERDLCAFESAKEDKQHPIDHEEYLRVWFDNLAMRFKLRLL
jgi:hypothetical protein